MKYLIQVRFNGADAVIHALPTEQQEQITAEFRAVRTLAGVIDGSQLESASAAKTVQINDGRRTVSDGPAVDPDAALDGYYLYETDDQENALAFAARIPVARMGGTVEVRPLMERQ